MDYNIGDIVRLKDGREVELEDITEDQQEDEYWASANAGGFNDVIIDSKDDVVAVVMTAAQAYARELPTAGALLGCLDVGFGDFEHIETEFDGDQAYFTVRAPDRQVVSFTVTVSDIHTSDL